MKKLLVIGILLSMGIVGFAYAHPGDDLDSASGCHVCRTNCAYWGEVYGEIHCHPKGDPYACSKSFVTLLQSQIEGVNGQIKVAQNSLSFAGLERALNEKLATLNTELDYLQNQLVDAEKSYNLCIENSQDVKDIVEMNTPDLSSSILNAGSENCITDLQPIWDLHERGKINKAQYDLYKDISRQLIQTISEWYKVASISCKKGLDAMNAEMLSHFKTYASEKIVWEICPENTYLGNDNQCYCNVGYINSSDNTTCVEISDNDIELESAISWMNINGLTAYSTIDDYKSNDYLTREQASKFFVLFSKNILGKTVDTKKSVSLSDLKKADRTLQSHIKESNQLGLFKGVKGKFLPFNKLTRAQTLAVIIRSSAGNQNEKGVKWYAEYYSLANSYGILDGLGFDYSTLDSVNITRGEVALLLYRLVDNGVVKQQ